MDFSDAAQVADGGFVSAGFHQFSNNGHIDACIARFDANGVLQWQKVWTAGPAYNSQAQAVLATADGGFAAAGYVEGNVAQGLFVMKFDGQDNVQWTKSYMPAANNSVAMGADGFTQLADGGFALQSLYGTLNGWGMLRTDAAGDVVWSDRLNPSFAGALDVAELPNGDLVFTGWGSDLATSALLLRKDGLTGTTEWLYNFGSDPGYNLDPFSVAMGPDSTIVLGGQCGALDGTGTIASFVMTISAGGVPQWISVFDTPYLDFGRDIAVDPNGGYVLCGYMVEDGTANDVASFVAKVDDSGQPIWSKRFDHADQGTERFYYASVTSDGGVLLSGQFGTTTSYPSLVVKLDANGNSCPYCPTAPIGTWSSLTPAVLPEGTSQSFGAWATAADHVFTVIDITASAVADVCGTVGVPEVVRPAAVTLAPNPFHTSTMLTLEIPQTSDNATLVLRDVAGRTVRNQRVRSGANVVERGGLSAGSYTYAIAAGPELITKGKVQVIE